MGLASNLWNSLIQSGLVANLPTTPEAIGGCFYYATDTDVLYFWNGTAWTSPGATEPVVVTTALTAKAISQTYLLDAVAGVSLTLPVATGSGLTIKVGVMATLTSGAYKILSDGTSILYGNAVGFYASTGAALGFQSLIATANYSIALAYTTAVMGNIGDNFELKDVAAGQWLVSGTYSSVGTAATTPFSTSKT